MSCGCGVLVMMIVVYTITVKAGLLGGHYHHQLRATPQELSENHHLQPTLFSSRPITTNQSTPGMNNSIAPTQHTTARSSLTTTTVTSMSVSPSHLPQLLSPLNSSHSLLTHDYTVYTPPPLSAKFTPLSRKDIKDVRIFVIFVGFARSGHSIVGTLMDAHPDIVIAHEYNVLKNIKKELKRSTVSVQPSVQE